MLQETRKIDQAMSLELTAIWVAGNERGKLPLRLGGSELVVTQQGGGLLAAQGIPSCFQPTNALPGAPAHMRKKTDFRPRACLPLATVWKVGCFLRLMRPCDQTVYCSACLLLQCNRKFAGQGQVSCSSSHSSHSVIHQPFMRTDVCYFRAGPVGCYCLDQCSVQLVGTPHHLRLPPASSFTEQTWQHKVQQWMRHYLGLVGFDDSTKRRKRCAGDPCAKLAAKSSCSSCIHVAGTLI